MGFGCVTPTDRTRYWLQCPRRRLFSVVVCLMLVGRSAAQSPTKPQTEEAAPQAGQVDQQEPTPAIPASSSDALVDRTRLNLLGEVNAAGGEARRNENVRISLIDNNVLKELNQRLGVTATLLAELDPEAKYFGKVFGDAPEPSIHLEPVRSRAVRARLYWTHNNSAVSARSFFQVGDVRPARTNRYGFELGLPVRQSGFLTVAGDQRRLRGQVNGNVLVPAIDERTPLVTDPAARRIVESILSAYPAQPPNRTDIHPRALNTNSPQDINDDRGRIRLDWAPRGRDTLSWSYQFTLQHVEAFQLVRGQNPDTTTRNHTARWSWNRAWSPTTVTDFTLGFEQTRSLLTPDESWTGPFLLFARELEPIGGGGDLPVNRVQNRFRYGFRARLTGGTHQLTLGGELRRIQIHGYECDNHRGTFYFGSDFGTDLITNLRLGRPTEFRIAIGDPYRAFRYWEAQLYVADRWRFHPRWLMDWALRFEPVTRPLSRGRPNEVPYRSDWNNLAPRFGLAYRLPGDWGQLRWAYGLHYGQIFPATFMQVRFNPPAIIAVSVHAPDLVNPLRGIDLQRLNGESRSTVYRLDPKLSTPYEHVYSFVWQRSFANDWKLELGYVGSRAHRLLTTWWLNRARPVPGIPLTTATIDQRRPDPRYYDVRWILNGSRGYYDAAKLTLEIPRRLGLSGSLSYWFSKALDIGANYTSTASGRDARNSRSPAEDDYQKAMKGLSDFDQPHAVQLRLLWETPRLPRGNSWLARALAEWQLGWVALLKSGTPFTVYTGSDGPGWGNVDGVGNDNPILLDPSILGRSIDHPDTSRQRLPRAAFAPIQPTDRSGNLGRNTFRKDGIANVNASLARRWAIRQDWSLVLRVESLNLLNHPQFDEPGFSLSAPNFGQITNTLNDGRTFQFTLELNL